MSALFGFITTYPLFSAGMLVWLLVYVGLNAKRHFYLAGLWASALMVIGGILFQKASGSTYYFSANITKDSVFLILMNLPALILSVITVMAIVPPLNVVLLAYMCCIWCFAGNIFISIPSNMMELGGYLCFIMAGYLAIICLVMANEKHDTVRT